MNNRLSHTEEHVSDLENRIMETAQSEQQKGKNKEFTLRGLWNNFKAN